VKALGPRYKFIESIPPASILRGKEVRTHTNVSDLYLCELTVLNRARLATLDAGIKHPAAMAIA
jgi:hypothetical protein